MDLFKVSASAMGSQATRINTIASNMANAQSTTTENGGPYVKKNVVFESFSITSDRSGGLQGVKVREIVEDGAPPITVYDPGHPDADENGNVRMPNINVLEEMVNMMMAMKSYEANVKAFNISKNMYKKSLEIGRV
ncbi:MAG: flagellar basal body rod protein FlgC [Nitrospira sp.]|nr:flagellar basal body rod protein FlgC [bacterium]MBL7049357.1 flagellar basal body rod protein FlgC [Nitrospira sp.]